MDGREETADLYLLAVPHDVLLRSAARGAGRDASQCFRNLRRLRVSPITGVHFWFDRDVMAEPFLTLLDRTTQWIFNKSRLYGGPGDGRIPATGHQRFVRIWLRVRARKSSICASANCAKFCPEARAAKLVKATVIKETAATFSPEPGSDRWRPRRARRSRIYFSPAIGPPPAGPPPWRAPCAAAISLPKRF